VAATSIIRERFHAENWNTVGNTQSPSCYDHAEKVKKKRTLFYTNGVLAGSVKAVPDGGWLPPPTRVGTERILQLMLNIKWCIIFSKTCTHHQILFG
jgi:hypothetical protein